MSPFLLFSSLVILAVGSIPASSGPVPWDCLACMRQVEGGTEGICNPDGKTPSCGPYQIKLRYFQDAQRADSSLSWRDWQECTKYDWCSEMVVQAYMSLYATWGKLRTSPTCEHFARIHNGGPDGWKKSATVSHWTKVRNCLR